MRPAWSGLKGHRGGRHGKRTNPVVLGRKFCARCGRWRHACDFRRCKHNGDGLHSYCAACHRSWWRERRARRTAEERERDREYQAIWWDAKARERGISRRSVKRDLPIERVFLDRGPLVEAMERFFRREQMAGNTTEQDSVIAVVGRASGISDRSLYRILNEQENVRLDMADRIAVAIGVPLELLYPYEEAA